MKLTTNTLLLLAATTAASNAALSVLNADFAAGLANWTTVSTGSDALETSGATDFRAASGSDNWWADTTGGETGVVLFEGDNGNEAGYIFQTVGTADAGTYTFSILEAGITSFGGGTGAIVEWGFSTDGGATFVGTSGSVSQNAGDPLASTSDLDLQNAAQGLAGTAFSGASSFTAVGGETVTLVIRKSHTAGRNIATVADTSLSFTPVPEPSSTALLGLGGLAFILRRRK